MLSITAGSSLAANVSIIITSLIIVVSFGFMAYTYYKKAIALRTLLPFLINFGLLVNLFILSYVRIGSLVTMLSVFLLPVVTLWAIIVSWKKHRWVSVLNILFELFLVYVAAMLLLIIAVLSSSFQ